MSVRVQLYRWSRRCITQIPFIIELQLFITLCSWPFLAGWGIPLAYASLMGNLLFTPFLMLFLVSSSLLYLFELIGLYLHPLIIFLEGVTSVWMALLSLSDRSWLFMTVHPPLSIAIMLSGIACGLMTFKPLTQKARIVIFICLLWGGGSLIPQYLSRSPLHCSLPYGKKRLSLFRTQRVTFLIERGAFGSVISASRQIESIVVPELIRKGISHITTMIVQRPSQTTFTALATLVDLFPVTTIYIPSWTGVGTNRMWAAWETLLSKAHQNKVSLVLIDRTTSLLVGNYRLMLQRADREITQNRCRYRKLFCTLTLA